LVAIWNQWEIDELKAMNRPVPQLTRPSALQTGAFFTLVERLHGSLRLNLSFQVG
jgi:hypothetical protein